MGFISGAHCPNGPITLADLDAIKLGGFTGAKVLSYHHTVEDIKRLKKVGIKHFAIRLPDSIWPVLDGGEQDTGHRFIPSALDYARRCESQFLPLIEEVPDADLILDNEPNYRGQWPSMWLAWAGRFAGSGDWRAFMADVLDILLFEYPHLNWCFTPMAWTEPNSEEWMHSDLIGRCKKVTCHSYWQSQRTDPPGTPHPPGPSPMYYEQFGGNAAYIHSKFPDKRIVIGEYGNSLTDRRNTPQEVHPVLIQDAMRRQYPLFLSWCASQGFIDAAYVFIIGGVGWEGFEPLQPVLEAMSSAIKHLPSFPVPPQNRVLGEGRIIT